jgi:transglutaminase/protease-like cytokinesis protein 3
MEEIKMSEDSSQAALKTRLAGLKQKRERLSAQSPRPVKAIKRTDSFIAEVEQALNASGNATKKSAPATQGEK